MVGVQYLFFFLRVVICEASSGALFFILLAEFLPGHGFVRESTGPSRIGSRIGIKSRNFQRAMRS